MAEKLWNGRFAERTDHSVETFTASIAFDKRLYAYDIEGSVAHCRMLVRQRIIPRRDGQRIIAGLQAILRELDSGRFRSAPAPVSRKPTSRTAC